MTRGRRRYLVCYDIREPGRLRRVHKTMKEYGWPMQYSVFVSDLDAVELYSLRERIGDLMHHGEDSVAFVDCGEPGQRGKECFFFMGISPALPVAGPIII